MKKELLKKVGGLIVRHVATAAGGAVAVQGVAGEDWRIALIGAVVTVIGMVLSYLEKTHQPRA